MKAWWKSHIDHFLQIPMEKSIIDIKLVKKLAFHNSNYKHTLHRYHFGNKGKCLNVIQALFLSESFCNQPSLVSLYGPI